MSFAVYDYRQDIRNILVTPQIRSRFLKMEPGQVAQRHSHDLGQEIFLILQGEAEFEIDGEREVVRPGQLCVALTDQMHQVSVVGDEPMIMYLSVTPHIQPTHTFWSEEGNKLAPRFAPDSAYDVAPNPHATAMEHLDRYLTDVDSAAAAMKVFADAQHSQSTRLRKAIEAGNEEEARDARAAMWQTMYPLFQSVYSMVDPWNDLAASLQSEPS